MEVRERRVSISQLYGSDAQGPNVTTGIVGGVQLLLARNDLQHVMQTKTICKKPQLTSLCYLESYNIH